jgi:hypothetical protein
MHSPSYVCVVQVVGQQKMANAILPVVREAMGWH